MDVEVVEDDDVAGPQGGRELGGDVDLECRAIHGALDDPGGDEFIAAQARDEGLGLPLAEGRIDRDEPLSARAPPAQGRHVGLDAGLIDEDEPCGLIAHQGLTLVDPRPARRLDVRAFFLRGQQRFF